MQFAFRVPSSTAVLTAAVALTLAPAGSAYGAGFAIIEHSVTGLGNAFAGGAASAEDATTVFFNPAGLARLPGRQFVAGAHIIQPTAEFDNEGSTHVLGAALSGTDGGDAGVTKVVPNLYYSQAINSQWTVGLGVNAPFGLATDYDEAWVGRYHALESVLTTININPSAAVKVGPHLRLGFGVSAQYVEAEISNAIDFGTINALPVALGGFGGAFAGLVPQASDGRVELEGDDWSYGFNLGLLYEFNQNTRVGVAYRSQVKHDVEGDADFTTPTPLIPAGTGRFVDTGAQAQVTLPDSLSLSVYHRLNPQWALTGDITWTNWSVFDELRFEFDNPLQPDGVTTTEWDDSYRYAVGLTFTPNEQWTWRAGLAYDETPIPDAPRRTPRIPGEDRTWVAFGVGYRASERFRFDVGYTHLFIDDPEIRKTPTGEDAVRGGLIGTWDADVDIFSAQLSWNF